MLRVLAWIFCALLSSSELTEARVIVVSLNHGALLVTEGDSLTFGFQASTPNNDYPSQLLALYTKGEIGLFANVGTNSDTIANIIGEAATQVDPKLRTDRVNVLAIWAGTNDFALNGVAEATVFANLKSYCQARRALGWKVIVLTMLPRPNTGADPTIEVHRTAYNSDIRSNWTGFADALADVGADSNIGAASANTNLTYYNSDQIHLNDTGYGVVASIVKAQLDTLL